MGLRQQGPLQLQPALSVSREVEASGERASGAPASPQFPIVDGEHLSWLKKTRALLGLLSHD